MKTNQHHRHTTTTTSADYVLPQFKNLRRLLAVHGRTSLFRNCQCILLSLYKSLIIVTALIVMSIYRGISGASIFDGLLFTIYNVIFLSIPPALVGFFGKDCSEELSESQPQLYSELNYNGKQFYMRTSEIATWCVESFVHAIVIFFIMYEFMWWQDLSAKNGEGRSADLIITSTMMMSVCIFVALGKYAVQIRYFQPGIVLSFILTCAIYFIYLTVYSNVELVKGSTSFRGIALLLWKEPKFWLFAILSTFGLLSIDLFVTSVNRHIRMKHILYRFDQIIGRSDSSSSNNNNTEEMEEVNNDNGDNDDDHEVEKNKNKQSESSTGRRSYSRCEEEKDHHYHHQTPSGNEKEEDINNNNNNTSLPHQTF